MQNMSHLTLAVVGCLLVCLVAAAPAEDKSEELEKRATGCSNSYNDAQCDQWAREGECMANPNWMHDNCQRSCGTCQFQWAGNGGCNVNGRNYANGQTFTIPGMSQCIKYKCHSGGWNIIEEACDLGGVCHPVGSTFNDDCVTYRCDKTNRGGSNWYQPTRISSKCKDVHGSCRNQGEFFQYAIGGRVFNHCHCTIQADGYTNYRCDW